MTKYKELLLSGETEDEKLNEAYLISQGYKEDYRMYIKEEGEKKIFATDSFIWETNHEEFKKVINQDLTDAGFKILEN